LGDDQRSTRGENGPGLSILHRMAELNGSGIELPDMPQGAKFKLALPGVKRD
jgi:hypothetical protein